MRRSLLLLALCLCTLAAAAQTPSQYVLFTASNITDLAGNKLASGTFTATPVLTPGSTTPAAPQLVGGGRGIAAPIVFNVTSGVLSAAYGTAQLVDVTQANPANFCYSTQIHDNNTGNTWNQDACLQPAYTATGCTVTSGQTTCDYDNMVPTGVPGALQEAGTPGINWKRAWSSVAAYQINDAVSYDGSTYVNSVAGNTGVAPPGTGWSLVAQAGTISIGSTATGAPGTAANVTNTGTGNSAQLNFTIPQGLPSLLGASKGAWASGATYSTGDVVSYSGSSYASLIGSNFGNEPDISPSDWGTLVALNNLPTAFASQSAANPDAGTFTAVAAGTSITTPNLNSVIYANLYASGGSGTSASPWTSASGTGGIKEALNVALALPATTGNLAPTVYLPTGNYSITAPIVIPSSVNLIGAGWSSILVPASSMTSSQHVILVQPPTGNEVKGFDFSHFTIKPASGTPAGCGIMFDGTNNFIGYGHVHDIQIYQLGSNAICSAGTGARQGILALSTIENSLLTGGISLLNGGDTVHINHVTIGGTGENDFGLISGAVGFVLENSNITILGGTHFGATISSDNNYYLKILHNEFETETTGGGSNGAVLDMDQNVVGGEISGNSFAVVNSSALNGLRLNSAVDVQVGNNTFERGVGAYDIVATSSAAHNIIAYTNYFASGLPYTSQFVDSGVSDQFQTSYGGHGFILNNAAVFGSITTAGQYQPLLEMDSSNNTDLFGYGGIQILQGANNLVSIYDGSTSHYLAGVFGDGIYGTPQSGTFFSAYNMVCNAAGNLYDSAANILLPCNAGGHTGSTKVVLATSPALLGTPTAPTAALGTNTTQLATTAFVQAAIAPTIYTVSTLPTCNSGAKGTETAVTDATSPTYLGTLTGGGTVYAPVVCNGTAWVSY
jgi:hypothetical protein